MLSNNNNKMYMKNFKYLSQLQKLLFKKLMKNKKLA